MKLVFPRFLALVEVFGDFRPQIRIQHVQLVYIDAWTSFTYLLLGPFINNMPPDSGVVWEALIRL